MTTVILVSKQHDQVRSARVARFPTNVPELGDADRQPVSKLSRRCAISPIRFVDQRS